MKRSTILIMFTATSVGMAVPVETTSTDTIPEALRDWSSDLGDVTNDLGEFTNDTQAMLSRVADAVERAANAAETSAMFARKAMTAA